MEDIDFNPHVYNFVLPSGYAESFNFWNLNSFEAVCPSAVILLDHTLAVIWHIFASDSAELTNLNRADIMWALRFLESIDTKDAGDTTALTGLIKLLRHILITRYAADDEKSMMNQTKTFLDLIQPDSDMNSSSMSVEEYLSCPEVQVDLGKAASIASIPPSKCTKAEMTQELKNLMKNSPGMSVEELVEMLEKS
jgi:hypothetical protein